MRSILVVHAEASRLIDALVPLCPGETFTGVDSLAAIQPALAAHEPAIVFCIKSSSFLGPEFHALVQHPSVRWVHVGGLGVEHLGTWDAARVTVTNSAGVLAPYLAETWLGAVLALDGGLLEWAGARGWGERRFRAIRGQRLLLVGLGEVGRRVAELAKAAGMETEAIRAHPERGGADRVFGPEQLDARLPHADIVSLHVRSTPSTRHLIDARRLALMKPGALFVNSARGAIVDEAALAERLIDGHLRGAWLDVFEREPLPETSPLWGLPNVLITPHAADQVEGWALLFVDRFVEELGRRRAAGLRA